MPSWLARPKTEIAVNNPEIDSLGAAAHLRRHAGHRHAEHFRRGHRVNILALGKRRLQLRNIGDMGKEAQFDLRAIKARRIFRPHPSLSTSSSASAFPA
jgi:hypothetical protein